MNFDALRTMDIIELMENFIDKNRPNEEIRDKIDLAYRIEGQSIFIFETSPHFIDPEKKIESPIAKTTYVKAKSHWKVFWLRGNLKWYPFVPKPTVKSLSEFIKLVTEDKHGCFWG